MLEERIIECEDEIRDLHDMIEINEADYLERMNKCLEEMNGQILLLKEKVNSEEKKSNEYYNQIQILNFNSRK